MGEKENDMTAGLAYVLSQAPKFLLLFCKEIFGAKPKEISKAKIRMQTNRPKGGGVTDIEIQIEDRYFAIIEAKRGLAIPSEKQLRKYAPHLRKSKAHEQRLVSLSSTAEILADIKLPVDVRGIPVIHRAWRTIKTLSDQAVRNESNSNKRLLREFSKYLEGILGMENIYSNMVYVVSLGRGNPKDWDISWIDIVEKRKRYFYTSGSNWPDPPNYIGFRYHGRLQSIYRVKKYQLISDPSSAFAEAPSYEWDPPCYLLYLENRIAIDRVVKCGPRIVRAARCWCMLDTLLTCKTLSEAKTETEKRIDAAKNKS